MPEPMLTISEVANTLSLTNQSVLRYIHSGKLKAIKLGYKSYRIEQNEFNNFLNTKRVKTLST